MHHEPSRTASYGTLRAANPTRNRYTQISRVHHLAAANGTAGILVSITAAHLISLLWLNKDFDTGSKIAAAF